MSAGADNNKNSISPFIPDEILKRVDEKKRLNRFYSLRTIFYDFHKGWGGSFFLQEELLFHAVDSYFCDLERMKAFHNIENGDQHKRAAFTAKWLTKIRPIQTNVGGTLTKASMLVNEMYAIHAAVHHLDVDTFLIPDELVRNLLYTLHNRELEGEVLATLFYTIETIAKKKEEQED